MKTVSTGLNVYIPINLVTNQNYRRISLFFFPFTRGSSCGRNTCPSGQNFEGFNATSFLFLKVGNEWSATHCPQKCWARLQRIWRLLAHKIFTALGCRKVKFMEAFIFYSCNCRMFFVCAYWKRTVSFFFRRWWISTPHNSPTLAQYLNKAFVTLVYEARKGCDTLGNFSGGTWLRPLDLTAECPSVIEETSRVFQVDQWARNFVVIKPVYIRQYTGHTQP